MPQTTTILKADGAEAGKLELADSLFGAPVNESGGNHGDCDGQGRGATDGDEGTVQSFLPGEGSARRPWPACAYIMTASMLWGMAFHFHHAPRRRPTP